MIINHNMNAMNAHRNMGMNTNKAGKAMEKLSSGLRINRAGDDAAGLSISEKMRGQIRGLDQASRNAQDGISMIQTAEGALDETHSILQRMRELSVQSSNDTNVEADRNAITEELKQLTKEIDRIAETTQFNTQNLVDGSFKGKFQIGANQGQTLDVEIGDMGSKSLGLQSGVKGPTVDIAVDAAGQLAEGTYTVNDAGTGLVDKDGNIVGTIAGNKLTVNTKEIDLSGKLNLGKGDTLSISKSATAGNQKFELTKAESATSNQLNVGDYIIKDKDVMLNGKKVGSITAADTITFTDTTIGTAGVVDTKVLGIKVDAATNDIKFSVEGVNVNNADNATATIDVINKAIENVSTQRSTLGATQNRLEHTINNLNNSSENLQAAESRIRDVDMAKEMLNFSKDNILQQAAQSMLAQAKSQPEGVLQLLR